MRSSESSASAIRTTGRYRTRFGGTSSWSSSSWRWRSASQRPGTDTCCRGRRSSSPRPPSRSAWRVRRSSARWLAASSSSTRVRTENNETLTVPNTELTANSIVRLYGREQYRVAMEVGIEYDDDVDAAMDGLRAAAESHREILNDPEPRVYFDEFGDDAVLLEIRYWIRDPTRRDVRRVRSEFGLDVKSRFEAAGLTISPASEHELSGHLDVDGSAGDAEADRNR
ncbi:hypothetical protein BRD15_06465 [Halobacteriales archaeon SW_6_65_15]|nr:MAG: hypothetical protein BRD15_06465 [Halobacteriales archaeon SW_6_65_15]